MTFHEHVPPVGTRCGDNRCGHAIGRGQPRAGWVRVFVAGSGHPAVWYSSYECLVFAVGLRPALVDEPLVWPRSIRRGFTVGEAVRLLSRYSGYRLTTLSLTPVRVGYAYRAATERLDLNDPQYDTALTALIDARATLLSWCGLNGDTPATPEVGDDEGVEVFG